MVEGPQESDTRQYAEQIAAAVKQALG